MPLFEKDQILGVPGKGPMPINPREVEEQSKLQIPQGIKPFGQGVKPGVSAEIIRKEVKPGSSMLRRIVDEYGWDMALILAAGAVGAGAVSILAPPLAPAAWAGLGTLGQSVLMGAGAGIAYGGAREIMRAAGGPKEPSMAEEITGRELYTGPLAPIGRISEEGLLWAAFPLAGRGAKGTLKGIQRVGRVPARALEPIAEKVWDQVVVKATHLPMPGRKIEVEGIKRFKTIREAFQPAIERLRKDMPEVGEIFRETKTQRSLVTGASRRLVNESLTLLPTERYELLKGLTGTSLGELKSARVKDMIRTYEGELFESTRGRYRSAFKKQFQKVMYEPISNIEAEYVPESISRKLQQFERVLKSKKKIRPSDVEGVLDSLIRHPRTTPAMKQFAKDLYSLPASTPIEVAKATHKANMTFLKSELLETPGIVSHKMQPGFTVSKHGGLKGLHIPKDIELELDAMEQIPKMAIKTYNRLFMSPWKTNKVILRPATHFRNLMSNMILNDWGGLPFWRADIYARAFKELSRKGPIYKEWTKIMGESGTFGREEILSLEGALKYEASALDKMLSIYDKVSAPARAMYSAEETLFKLAKYIHNLEKGMEKLDAAYDAMKWTFNYSEITPTVGWMRQTILPFGTWWTKVIPLTIETAVKHPIRFGKWLAFLFWMHSYAQDKIGLSEGEWASIHSTLPEYMQRGLYLLMPWRDERGQLKLLNLTWMLPGIGDFSEMYQRGLDNPITLAMQNPILNMYGTLQSQKKYSGAPLYYDWEPASTKFTKAAKAVWEMWAPAPAPGNIDWRSLWDAMQEVPEALTPEEAIASQFGFRLTTVDPVRMAKRRESLRRIHESEMTTQMRKELRRAKDPKESHKILEKYSKIRIQRTEKLLGR